MESGNYLSKEISSLKEEFDIKDENVKREQIVFAEKFKRDIGKDLKKDIRRTKIRGFFERLFKFNKNKDNYVDDMEKILKYDDLIEISNLLCERGFDYNNVTIEINIKTKKMLNRISNDFFYRSGKPETEKPTDIREFMVNVNGVKFKYTCDEKEEEIVKDEKKPNQKKRWWRFGF